MKYKFDEHLDGNGRNAGRTGSWWQPPLTCVLWLLLGLPPVAATAQTADANLLTTNSPFVLYLQNPPWIKKMVYVESAPWSSGPDPSHITKSGWANLTNRIGIQPDGIYLERLNDIPGGPPRPQNERIIEGSSGHYDWSAIMNQGGSAPNALGFSSKLPAEGWSSKNRLFTGLQREKLWKGRIRHFGLPPLQTNSFKLVGHDQFEAVTEDGYSLEGKILTANDNHPLALTFILGGSTDDAFAINYEYKPAADLPNYYERRELRNGHLYGDPQTNWIESVVYGIDVAATNGYEPSMFFTNLAIFTHIIVESNGQSFVIGNTGKRTVIDYKTPHPPLNTANEGKVVFVILVIFLATAGACLWWFRIRRREM